MFNPFGSSEETSVSTYATSTELQASVGASEVIASNSAKATTPDPEPFSWEDKKETVASTGILNDVKNKSTTKTSSKPTMTTSTKKANTRSFGERTLSSKNRKDPTQKTQTVSKTDSKFGDKAVSTVDDDLESFFGSSKRKPKTKPATKVAKAPKTTPTVKKATSKPVRVASKPVVDSAKSSSSWPTQGVKPSLKKQDEMLGFSSRTENTTDDAPMLEPVNSRDFDQPAIEPANNHKVAIKTKSRSQDLARSLEPALTKPAVASPEVKVFNIKNPLQTRLTVTFLANGNKIILKPGQNFKLRQSNNVQVKFSRGGSFGISEKSLPEGNYQFSVTRKEGWKLTQ